MAAALAPRPALTPAAPKWMSALDGMTPLKSAGLGVVLGTINPKNLLLIVGGAAAIAQTGVSTGDQVVAWIVFTLIATIGVAAPLVIYLTMGERAGAILEGLRARLVHGNAAIMAGICLIIGVKLDRRRDQRLLHVGALRSRGMRAGAILLVGGRSTRMGRAKATLDWHGEPLAARVARVLARAVGDGPVVAVAAPGQELPPLPAGVMLASDPSEGAGPLQGLAVGLAALRAHADVAFASSVRRPAPARPLRPRGAGRAARWRRRRGAGRARPSPAAGGGVPYAARGRRGRAPRRRGARARRPAGHARARASSTTPTCSRSTTWRR